MTQRSFEGRSGTGSPKIFGELVREKTLIELRISFDAFVYRIVATLKVSLSVNDRKHDKIQ